MCGKSVASPVIKSRARVAEHGEVYTSEREVNAMLHLVRDETLRIDSRFLEPACGNGNFLAPILERKLSVVAGRYSSSRALYEQYSILALSSIYGIDILSDNVAECRERLFLIFHDAYVSLFSSPPTADYLLSARHVLRLNILWGDALTLATPDDARTPISFAEWSMVEGMMSRRDFHLSMLLQNAPYTEPSLFDELGEEVFIPTPHAEYPLTPYDKIHLL